jgi:hypothetical protein
VSEFGLCVICYCGGHECRTVTVLMYFLLCCLATGFQTYKQISIGATVSVCRSECLVVSGEK